MNKTVVIINIVTAFIIAAGGCVITAFVAAKGAMPPAAAWVFSGITGLIAAGKDTRSLFKLPPVEDTDNSK